MPKNGVRLRMEETGKLVNHSNKKKELRRVTCKEKKSNTNRPSEILI